jgi:hypothetical protein
VRTGRRADLIARVENERRRRYGGRPRGCGCGCGGFLVVLTLGIVLSLFHVVLALGVSVRVPFTDSNLSAAGSLGIKSEVPDALPSYLHGRLGGNQNLVNQSQTMTVGPAEGALVAVLGRQAGAPVFDLHLVAR